MTFKELKQLRKEINKKLETLEQLRSRAYKTTASFDVTPRGSGKTDRVGYNVADMTDLESEIKSLRAYYIKALRSLPDEDFAANCIYMRLVCGYTWIKIGDVVECDSSAVKMACNRYKWELTDKYNDSIYRVIPSGII